MPRQTAVCSSSGAPATSQSPFWPDWSQTAICAALTNLYAADRVVDYHALGVALGLYQPNPEGTFTPTQPAWIADIAKLPAGDAIVGLIYDAVDGLGKLAVNLGKPDAQRAGFVVYYRALNSILGLARQYLRVDLGDVQQSFEYARSFLSPTNLPSQGQADQLYYRDQISVQTWECLTKANDNLPTWFRLSLESGRTRPSVAEAGELTLRGRYSLADYAQVLREHGYTRQSEINDTISLLERFPSLDQAFLWQQSAVFNSFTVERYKLATDEDTLDQLPYAQWIKAAGFGSDALSAIWRTHWTLPSLGEMTRAVQRLRPGAVAPSLVVTESDVDYFLKAGNVHPWWRDRLKWLTVLPLGRREVSQAYVYGVVGDDETIQAILDTGHNQRTAEILLAYYKRRRQAHWRSSKWVALVKDGVVGISRAKANLMVDGCPPDVADFVLAEAMAEFEAASRKEVVKSIRHYYTTHGLGAIDAQGQLTALGLDPDQVNRMLVAWEVERRAHPREASAGQIVQWLDDGLLTAVEAAQRLALMGYTGQDAGRIIARAQQLFSARQASRAEKAARDIERARAQEGKTAEKRQRQEDAAAKARQVQQARRQAFLERTTRSRLVTVSLYSQRSGNSALQAEGTLAAEAQRLKREFGLSDNEAWDVLKAAVHKIPRKGEFDLHQIVTEAAEAERDLLQSLVGQGNGTVPTG